MSWNPMKSAQPQKKFAPEAPKRQRDFRLESSQYQILGNGEKMHFPFKKVDNGIVRNTLTGQVVDEIISHMPTPGTFVLEIKSTGEKFDYEREYDKMLSRLEILHNKKAA